VATTLSNATLTVTLTESINLNGSDQGSTNTLSIDEVNEVYKRIVTVTTNEVEILAMDTAIAGGTFDTSKVMYIRITNKDNANHAILTFKSVGNHEFAVKLDKGQSFIYNGDIANGVAATMDADSGPLTLSLADLVNITADADTTEGGTSVDLEIFVACK
tara:strand:- start:4 stop:483 length:480 start_codon:yes stop_codon:yes gene_type:complete